MRYFIEVSYKGTNYAGFQIQKNASTIQSEVERALFIFFRRHFSLTGSSRTDAGVHALQNFFHFDADVEYNDSQLYNINSILPADIVLKSLKPVADTAHCRFDATAREYYYYIYNKKNPFLSDRAWYYPYPLNIEILQQAASVIIQHNNFLSFSKKNSQVHTHTCNIMQSTWLQQEDCLIYQVRANRFLRGMVRALVATMLKAGRGKLTIAKFRQLITQKDSSCVDFSAPPHGLFLAKVQFPY